MATLFSILAWETQWTEESGGYCPRGRKRVRQDLPTGQQQHSSMRLTGSSHLIAGLKRGSRGLAQEA